MFIYRGVSVVQRGFTLVEMIAVLVIISIISISVLPRAQSTESMVLNGRALQLASDLRYVQARSMTGGQRFCLSLTASGYSLTTTDGSNNCTATTDAHPAGLAQPIQPCVSCITWSNLPANVVQFDGLGVPYTAAATTLASNAVITLADGGITKTVTISPTTGRILVQ